MSKEEKKTNDEDKTIPNPEGYTIVKYAEGWADFILVLGVFVSFFIGVIMHRYMNVGIWLFLIVCICVLLLCMVIAHKITEVKVNLKITDKGLEQIKLSGSKQYPSHRMIKWEDMKRYHLCGRGRNNDFLINVNDDVNFRISIPLFTLFEKQKGNWNNFATFKDDFLGIAPEHDVHRAFFG